MKLVREGKTKDDTVTLAPNVDFRLSAHDEHIRPLDQPIITTPYPASKAFQLPRRAFTDFAGLFGGHRPGMFILTDDGELEDCTCRPGAEDKCINILCPRK